MSIPPRQVLPPPKSEAVPSRWLAQYHEALRVRLETPHFALAPRGHAEGVPELGQLFVPPETDRALAIPAPDASPIGIQLTDVPSAIVTGESGIGKSTLLAMAALGQLDEGGVAFYIELAGSDSLLKDDALLARRRGLRATSILRLILDDIDSLDIEVSIDDLVEVLRTRETILFLDGINELNDRKLRNGLLTAIPVIRTRFPLMRVICSVTLNAIENGELVIPHGMAIIRLLPLGLERAAEFLDTFVRAHRPAMSVEARRALWNPALKAVRRHPEVFGYPLFLSAIAVTLLARPDLQRAESLHSSYDVLRTLARWIVHHHAESIEACDEESLGLLLECLCFEMVSARSGARSSIGIDQATSALPAVDGTAGIVLLKEMASRGGFVRLRWGDIVVMDLLRDYFAASKLARFSADGKPLWETWLDSGLRDVAVQSVLGFVPLAILENSGTQAVAAFIDAVLARVGSLEAESVALALGQIGRALTDIRLRGIELDYAPAKVASVLHQLDTRASSPLEMPSLKSRCRVKDTVGLLIPPDPSELAASVAWFKDPRPLVLGSQDADPDAPGFDPLRAPWELSPREITLPPFGIGIFPVTVSEFEKFVESGGYKNDSWSVSGLAWRRSQAVDPGLLT